MLITLRPTSPLFFLLIVLAGGLLLVGVFLLFYEKELPEVNKAVESDQLYREDTNEIVNLNPEDIVVHLAPSETPVASELIPDQPLADVRVTETIPNDYAFTANDVMINEVMYRVENVTLQGADGSLTQLQVADSAGVVRDFLITETTSIYDAYYQINEQNELERFRIRKVSDTFRQDVLSSGNKKIQVMYDLTASEPIPLFSLIILD